LHYNRIGPLLARGLRLLDDSVISRLAGTSKNREDGSGRQEVHRIVTPNALGDHAAVHIENNLQFAPIEANQKIVMRACPEGIARQAQNLKIGFGPFVVQAQDLGLRSGSPDHDAVRFVVQARNYNDDREVDSRRHGNADG
jgi:hypothetical protein